mgnify:CR=1 FL=1
MRHVNLYFYVLYKMKTELSSRRPASNTQLSIKQLFNVHDVISHVKKNQH